MICNVITQPVRDLAKELNISPSYANNLVSVWRNLGKHPMDKYPRASTLKSIMKWGEDEELATPDYENIEYNEGDKLASTSKDYKITLRRVFEKKPLEFFFDYIQGNVESETSKQKQIVFERLSKEGYTLDKLRDLVQDGKEAYRFLLWHEMSHIENDDYSNYWKEGEDLNTPDKIEIEYRATLDAIKKAEKWRKKNPRKRVQTNTPINIYYGNNENADLSNFAIRPFYTSSGVDDNFSTQFQTVEGAFQAQKLMYALIPIEEKERIEKSLSTVSGASARSIGNKIPNLDKNAWDSNSSRIMKKLLKESFEENPQALQRLLATGNVLLTHNQAKGKWKTEFPKLLMEVREELRQSIQAEKIPQEEVPTSSATNSEQAEKIKNLGENHSMFSGEAEGADLYWRGIANQYGIKGEDFTVNSLNKDNRAEATEKVEQANKTLNRVFPMKPGKKRTQKQADYANDLLLRDWLQVKSADSIIAIGRLKNSIVEGGTGWAVQMAINEGKPVYVFSQNNGKWYKNINGKWESSDVPTLTPNFAGIGTRELNDAGKQAIVDVFTKTFGESPANVNVPTNKEKTATQVDNGKVIRSFEAPTEDIVEQYNQMMSLEASETQPIEYSNELPQVGNNVISINRDTPRAKALMAFSAPIRKDRERLLSKQFSSIIDASYEELLDSAQEELREAVNDNDLNRVSEITTRIDALNDPETGRRKVVEEITVEEILNRLKAEWESYLEQTEEELDAIYGEGQGKYMLNEYQKVLDHFDILIEDAANDIEKNEGIRIMIDRHEYHSSKDSESVLGGTVVDDTQSQEIKDEENNDDEDARINNSEGWGFKVRFVDPHSTISKVVKKVLGNIIKENEFSGEPEYDDLGNVKYLEEENAHAILMEGLSSMIDADDFSTIDEAGNIVSLPALEKMTEKYPWVNQVIDAILADNDLASKFFADFRKEFISYWAQKEGKTFMLNESIAVEDTMNETIHNYETGSKLSNESIYNTNRSINTNNANMGINKTDDILDSLSEYDETEEDSIISSILEILKMLGVKTNSTVIRNTLNSEDGIRHLEDVVYAAKEIFSGAINMEDNAHLIDSFSDEYNKIATIVGIVSETGGISSFRSGDKTFYSYSASNYLDGMFKSFKRDDRRDSYLSEQFKKFKWFFEEGEWKNDWLRQIEEDEEVRSVMSLIELNNINDTYYTEWSPTQIKSAFVKQYFAAGYNPGSKKQFGWYNFPIFSDSPVVKFIKFTRYTENFKEELLPKLVQVVKQELGRIKHVQDRRANNIPAISNYDKRGDKFHFFPELNYLTTREGILYKDLFVEAINSKDNDALNTVIEQAMSQLMDMNFNRFINNLTAIQRNTITNDLISEGVMLVPEELNNKLEEFFWNQTFATSQIIQITTTDLAFYKNQVDFQKRYKEVYGAGTKLNTNSKYGRKNKRTIYLSDHIITSFKYQNIKDIINDAENISDIDKAFILTKFRDINVDDAQAYRSLDSFRSILDMLGKWTPEMENTYNRIINNQWDISDFNIVWQTIKPFVFTQVSKPDGLGDVMKVPHQNKNSEFLIMAMYSMFSKEMNKSPKLRALNRFMTDNNIDVAQFESAAKVGGQGIIDINISPSGWAKLSGAFDSFEDYKKHMDNDLDKGRISQEEYNKAFKALEPTEEEVYQMLEDACFTEGEINPYVVHELPYSDYVVQQPTPEHLFDALGIYGSQFRNLIISDISEDAVFTINGRQYNKEELLSLYQSLIIENLLDSYDSIKEAFDPDNIENLQSLLLKQVKGNPKYGRDIVEALQIVEVVNPVTGRTEKVFNIPLSNPTTTLKIQELINSVFKNRITKQHIKGGNAILVSDFGLTDKLNIVYNVEGDKTSGIKGIECYLPAYSKQFYEPFMVTKTRRVNGVDIEYQELDVKKLQQAGLDKIIGYRIPTESKYSMAPLIIKGFLPQQNGSAIMLPADITTIAGSDFDVDKMFLMIPEFKIVKEYDLKEAWDDFYEENPSEADAVHAGQMKEFLSALQRDIDNGTAEALDIDLEDTEVLTDLFYDYINKKDKKSYEYSSTAQKAFSKWFTPSRQAKYFKGRKVVKVTYNQDKAPEQQSIEARNNMLIDIAFSILTNKDTASKVLTPGSFDKLKKASRINIILSNRTIYEKFKEEFGVTDDNAGSFLLNASLKQLDDFVSDNKQLDNPLGLDNFVYFHNQNMTGGSLIGAYANNTTLQAKYQGTSLRIKDGEEFFVNGRRISKLTNVISDLGERISNNCAEFSAGSVDNGKNPVLADLMQNMFTAKVTAFMLRAGMSIEEIGLLFNQPYVKRVLSEGMGFNNKVIGEIVEKAVNTIEELGGSIDIKQVLNQDYTSIQLINNVIDGFRNLRDTDKVGYVNFIKNNVYSLLLMSHISSLASDLNAVSKISRADSPNAAVDISIAGAKLQSQAVTVLHRNARLGYYKIAGFDEVISNNYITPDMSKEEMREKLKSAKMPMLQAFYSLGIDFANRATAPFFIQTTDYVNGLVEELFNNTPTGIIEGKGAVRQLNNFYNDLIIFGLTKTELFGDSKTGTYEQKRNYYLNSYPKEFIKVIANNPDIANLSSIKKMDVDGNIIMKKSARLSQLMRETLMRDFDSLLYMDNPAAQKLAIDLFTYSFYKEGMSFGPNNFGYFFSSQFLSSFPEFINALRTMQFSMYKGSYFDKFLEQYYANHYKEGVIPVISDSEDLGNGEIMVETKAVYNRNFKSKRLYNYITTNDKLYKVDATRTNDSKTVYVEIPTAKTTTAVYNANKDVYNLTEGIEAETNIRYESQPELNDFAQTDTDLVELPSNIDNILAGLEEGKYSEELGESQLEHPLCLSK